MDLIAIIEHRESAKDLVSINLKIDNSIEFRSAYSKQYPDSLIRNSKWKGPLRMTENNLHKIWIAEKNQKDPSIELKGLNYYAEMDIPYAELRFHQNTISISPHGLHKYGNFRTPKWASFILKMNREIAKIFNSTKIVYCVDSYEPQELIYDKSLNGNKLETLIKIGNEKFGIPPNEINAAVKNLYFIDEFNLNLDDLIEWEWKDIGR